MSHTNLTVALCFVCNHQGDVKKLLRNDTGIFNNLTLPGPFFSLFEYQYEQKLVEFWNCLQTESAISDWSFNFNVNGLEQEYKFSGIVTGDEIYITALKNNGTIDGTQHELMGLNKETRQKINKANPITGNGLKFGAGDKKRSEEHSDFNKVFELFIRSRANEEKYRNIITNMNLGLLEVDNNDIITYANKSFCSMSSYSTEELLGKNVRSLLASDATDLNLLDKIAEKRKSGISDAYELEATDKNGDAKWWLVSGAPCYDDSEKVVGTIAIHLDITRQKNEGLKKTFFADIRQVFAEDISLNKALSQALEKLVKYGMFSMAEFWLISADKKKITPVAQFSKTKHSQLLTDTIDNVKSYSIGEGLPGIVWKTQVIHSKNELKENFTDTEHAKKAMHKMVYGIPLIYNNETIGVLIVGFNKSERSENVFKIISDVFITQFGAEIKRKQIEEELNQIFLLTPDILCIANTDGHFKKINPAMSTILEYNEQELLSKPIIEFVHPLDKGKQFTELKNKLTGKSTYYLENRYTTKSGKVKWLAWTTTDVSEQGTLYCSAKDITDQKELEELLNKATTLARIGSWEINVLKETVYWSDITREIHEAEPGFTPTLKQAFNFYKKGKNRKIIVETMKNSIQYGTPTDVELQIETIKGNTKWIRVIGEAEFANDQCVRMYGSFQDIDGRKRAELAGKQALEERNTILESIDDAFFAVDKNWVVTYWNSMAEKVLEMPSHKIYNTNFWETFPNSRESESYKKFNEAVETNQAVHFEDDYPALNKWLEISAYPSATGLSVYFKDVSDRKLSDALLRELCANLQKQTRELAVSNAELEQFAYVASHDLQEPLRMVSSFMIQLEKKYGSIIDEKGRQYIHFAVDGAKRMREIILDLLDFSLVGKTESDLEKVDFNKLVNEILSLYRRRIEEVHATITFENLPVIQIYKTPVRQVFQNLVSNSLKYHRAGVRPIIKIACKETETEYQFSIKDNGIGIDHEYFDKIFIIFQRLHNKEEYSGTGMGLAITKKIVENMGGKIWLKSEEGKGSTFYFTLKKL